MSVSELLEQTASVVTGLAAGDAEAAEGKKLSFAMEKQKREEWCWSAVSVSVSKFYNDPTVWTQCSLVNAELSLGNCCANSGSDECNQPWFLDNGLERVGHLAEKFDASISFEDVMSEIDSERPVGCWIRWPDGTGHFVVLSGYARDSTVDPAIEYVSVRDPRYGSSDYPYLTFLTSYRTVGTWELSYLTQ